MTVLISCEVGGTRIPTDWSVDSLTGAGISDSIVPPEADAEADGRPGNIAIDSQPNDSQPNDGAAIEVARRWSDSLSAPLITNPYSSGLIDVSRSLHHRLLFPSTTRCWPLEKRQRLIEQIHRPYRERIRATIADQLKKSPYVVHLSIRSFAARHQGKHRRADVGLLYDPSRPMEVDFCLDWIDEMYDWIPMLRVRRNYPRRGTTDSITKSMRTEFVNQPYLGIEVLLNRAWIARPLAVRDQVIDQMCDCLHEVTADTRSDAA